eukprot:3656350-Rhodomonas_salina.1
MQEVENKVVWPGAICVRKNTTEFNTFKDMLGTRIVAGARHALVVNLLQAYLCASHGLTLMSEIRAMEQMQVLGSSLPELM